MTKEELAKQIMAECLADGEPVSESEALEMAEMEINAKGNRNYVQAEPTKKKSVREKKVDTAKADIITLLHSCLVENGYEATITNVDKYIEFGEYTINLVKHRPKK